MSGLFLKHLDLIYIPATSNCPLPKCRISASSFRDRNLRAATVVRDRVNASYKHKSNFLASNANRLSRGEIWGTSVPVLRPNSQRKCHNGRRNRYARCTLFRRRVKRVEVCFRRGGKLGSGTGNIDKILPCDHRCSWRRRLAILHMQLARVLRLGPNYVWQCVSWSGTMSSWRCSCNLQMCCRVTPTMENGWLWWQVVSKKNEPVARVHSIFLRNYYC